MGIELDTDATAALYMFQFADICAENIEDLECTARKLTENMTNWGFVININITKYLCIGAQSETIGLENNDNEMIIMSPQYKLFGILLMITKETYKKYLKFE